MDDRLREFGEVPGYEFDAPRASGQPRREAGGQRRRQPWPQPPPADPTWPPPAADDPTWPPPAAGDQPWPQWPPRQAGEWRRQLPPEPEPPASPGRPALLARDTLAAMRARNWLTSLAAPLLAAIAVGVAGVVVLGANNAGDSTAPSALAAGFPPARSAAADFGAGGGVPVQVSAIAAAGATEVAVGSADRGCALWVSADGGTNWRRAAVPPGPAGRPGAGQLAAVAHGAVGWLAVGDSGATAGQATALRPSVVGSPDGRIWTADGQGAAFDGGGRIVTAAVAAGRAGYVIVGQASAGRRTVAAAWYAPGLTGWRRASAARPGALDGAGNRAMNAVTAAGGGFVAVGAAGTHPAAWLSATGRTWRLVTLARPAGAASAALDYVAANGSVVAAIGTEVTAAGQRRPFAAVSADGGARWAAAPLPRPAGAVAATALTAAGGGFTATGVYGPPGQTDVVVWTLPATAAAGTAWTEVTPQGTGLAGPGMQAITALTATGVTLTGVGFTATSAATSAAMRTEPTIWQSPVRS
ncbi:MAG TPA: hypothetical protein VHZ33_25465 [Trebonia sp.]|jgi:hypothetical protein|nr:hypothetical protein [Trebonia sp.]